MKTIHQEIEKTDFQSILDIYDVDAKFKAFSNEILNILDHVAPLKSIKLKEHDNQHPWVDLVLSKLKNSRDEFYTKWSRECEVDRSSLA